MDLYKEFKRVYRKCFLENPDFLVSNLIRSTEDIPTRTEPYRNALVYAFTLLSNCKTQDIEHLKMLTNYEKLMKKNRDSGMRTSPILFATMLYLLHHYCVRILRSPWRKDYFTIKTYNGFYQYTLSKCLAPVVIADLLSFLGFGYDLGLDAFTFNVQSLNRQTINAITEAGIGFFLAYTHCMISNDPQFKKSIKASSYALQSQPRNPTPSSSQTQHPDRPSTSGISESRNGTREVISPHAATSSARERRREKHGKDMETKSIYGSDRSPAHSSYTSRSGATNTAVRERDLYQSQEVPMDLSHRNVTPYGHRAHRNGGDRNSNSGRSSPHSDYMDDQALYGSPELKLGSSSYAGTNDRELSLENSLNGRVLYPPNTTRQRSNSIGEVMGLGNIGFDDVPSRKDHVILKSADVKFRNSNSAAPYSANYVQLIPRRGSPDGEMTKDGGCYDHSVPGRQYKTSSKEQPRSLRNRERDISRNHIYHEIDDKKLYGP